MWKDYEVFTTKEEIIEKANSVDEFFGFNGSFVNTDGAWCMASTPEEFKEMLEHFFSFKVVECKETRHSTAVATTKCGLQISWGGFCKKLS